MEKEENFFDDFYSLYASSVKRGSNINEQIEFIKEKILSPLSKPKILDHCCGHGRHLDLLFPLGYDLTGVDNSLLYINKGKATLNPSVKLICADVKKLVLSSKFDVILSMDSSLTIFNWEELKNIIGNIYSMSEKEGIFLLHCFNPNFVKHILPERDWYELENKNFLLEERVFIREQSSDKQSLLKIKHIRFLYTWIRP